MATALVKGYEGEFDPTQFKDIYQERVRKIIDAEVSNHLETHPAAQPGERRSSVAQTHPPQPYSAKIGKGEVKLPLKPAPLDGEKALNYVCATALNLVDKQNPENTSLSTARRLRNEKKKESTP